MSRMNEFVLEKDSVSCAGFRFVQSELARLDRTLAENVSTPDDPGPGSKPVGEEDRFQFRLHDVGQPRRPEHQLIGYAVVARILFGPQAALLAGSLGRRHGAARHVPWSAFCLQI